MNKKNILFVRIVPVSMLVHYYYHFRPWLLAVAGFCFFAMKTIVFDTTTTLTKVPTPTTHHDMLRCDLAKITFFFMLLFL